MRSLLQFSMESLLGFGLARSRFFSCVANTTFNCVSNSMASTTGARQLQGRVADEDQRVADTAHRVPFAYGTDVIALALTLVRPLSYATRSAHPPVLVLVRDACTFNRCHPKAFTMAPGSSKTCKKLQNATFAARPIQQRRVGTNEVLEEMRESTLPVRHQRNGMEQF